MTYSKCQYNRKPRSMLNHVPKFAQCETKPKNSMSRPKNKNRNFRIFRRKKTVLVNHVRSWIPSINATGRLEACYTYNVPKVAVISVGEEERRQVFGQKWQIWKVLMPQPKWNFDTLLTAIRLSIRIWNFKMLAWKMTLGHFGWRVYYSVILLMRYFLVLGATTAAAIVWCLFFVTSSKNCSPVESSHGAKIIWIY